MTTTARFTRYFRRCSGRDKRPVRSSRKTRLELFKTKVKKCFTNKSTELQTSRNMWSCCFNEWNISGHTTFQRVKCVTCYFHVLIWQFLLWLKPEQSTGVTQSEPAVFLFLCLCVLVDQITWRWSKPCPCLPDQTMMSELPTGNSLYGVWLTEVSLCLKLKDEDEREVLRYFTWIKVPVPQSTGTSWQVKKTS